MKQFITILILIIAIANAVAQEKKDTLRIGKNPTIKLPDSLQLDKNVIDDFFPSDHDELKSKFPPFSEKEIIYSSENTELNTHYAYQPYSSYIVSASFISYGVIARFVKPLREIDYGVKHEVNAHLKSGISLDDYLQFVPLTAFYGLDFVGVKAKHNIVDRTIIAATSYAIMGAVVETTKCITTVTRPDEGNRKSFPSGHTASAFVSAHLLYREYLDVSPWIGFTGYIAAATTGTLRVTNQRHWVSDVIAGAGIGILSVEMGYRLLPVFKRAFNMKSNKWFVAMPSASKNSYGAVLAYTF